MWGAGTPVLGQGQRVRGGGGAGGGGYVQGRFMGGKDTLVLVQANRDVRKWCQEEAGMRIHGTTKEQPRRRFEEVEKERLKPLPGAPYDMAIWKQAKLHRDCHIVFEGSYYSAPFQDDMAVAVQFSLFPD